LVFGGLACSGKNTIAHNLKTQLCYFANIYFGNITLTKHVTSYYNLQIFVMAGSALDYKRLATLSAFGMLWHGPTGHYFYNWLDGKIPGTDAKSVFTKVAIDQILWCPVFMTVFFTYLGLVNGDSFATIGDKIKKDLFAAVQGSWKVWPLVHSVNFRFIKPKYRIPYINSFQIGFNMFLSIIGNK